MRVAIVAESFLPNVNGVSHSVLRVTSLPLGIPWPRIVRVLRGFEPDVVHLASPALLGYGGLRAAR